jgi:hypothetical protein
VVEKGKVRFIRKGGRAIPIKQKNTGYGTAAAIGASVGALNAASSVTEVKQKAAKLPSIKQDSRFFAKAKPYIRPVSFGLAAAGLAYSVKKAFDAEKGSRIKEGGKHYLAFLGGSLGSTVVGTAGVGAGLAIRTALRQKKMKAFKVLK